MPDNVVAPPSFWLGFTVFVLAMLALDLGVFHRKSQSVSVRAALGWTAVWVGLALSFNAIIYAWQGGDVALEFLTGYVIEYALSVDNIFVFYVVFSAFGVAGALQHRVLFWGILGALVMRACFVAAGAVLIQSFHGVIYVFGAFLVFTGVRLLRHDLGQVDPKGNPLYRLFARLVPTTDGFRGSRFLVRESGRLLATPLLLVLVAIEATDVVFAVDSIPAIFAVTDDPFIVYTSNIFAILGLRSLYFALSGLMDLFRYLNYGLAGVLMFVGTKMLVSGVYHVPIWASLAAIVSMLAAAIIASLVIPKPPTVFISEEGAAPSADQSP